MISTPDPKSRDKRLRQEDKDTAQPARVVILAKPSSGIRGTVVAHICFCLTIRHATATCSYQLASFVLFPRLVRQGEALKSQVISETLGWVGGFASIREKSK